MWLLVYLSNCIWCQQRSILQGKGKARPRWGNERTWSGIERTLHCAINIMDHILHIKHFKEIVTGWEKFAGFQVFLRVTVFVSTLLAQQCKNYKDLRASTLYYEAGMNLYRMLYIAQYTCFFLFTTRGNCKRTTCCTIWGNIVQNLQHCTTWGNERTCGANLNWQRPILLLKNCTFFFFRADVFPQNQNQGLLLCSSFPQNQNLELPSSRLASSRQSWGWQFLVTPLQTANKNALTLSVGNYWRIIYGQQK